MPTLYDISTTQLSSDLLPDSKRTTLIKSLVQGLLSAFDRLHKTFTSYLYGSNASQYSAGTYDKYDQVIYYGSVYESLIDSNTDLPNTTNWVKVLDSFIGTFESQLWDGSVISLTYALNKRFGTSYVDWYGGSEIYLEGITDGLSMFQVGYDENNSSSIYSNTCSEQLTYDDTTVYNSAFIVKVPALVYADIGGETPIRNFVDKYISVGIFYDVDDY